MSQLRILIADDHPVFRDGIRTLLEVTAGIEVTGEATTGEEAVALAEQNQPDLILMDVQMPGLNGIEATQRIVARHPDTRVLMLTMFEDDASVFAALRAGASGYILKDATKDEIRRAIQGVANGEAIFGPAIAARVITYFAQPRPSAPLNPFPELSSRENEILDLIARGWSNPQIADHLTLSRKTISNYVSNILSKLQVTYRTEAAARARDAGLGRE
jgi:DNA-binding NarL/FixJ family response regulator